MHKGITLSGGGALLPGLRELLQNVLKIPVYVIDDPLYSCGSWDRYYFR